MSAVTAPPQVGPADRFGLTFCLAIIIHAIIILGVTFAPEEDLQQRFNTMEIILVQQKSTKAPEDAQMLAQASLEGGGDIEEDVSPATPTPPPFPKQVPEVTAPPPMEQVPPPEAPAPAVEKTKVAPVPPTPAIEQPEPEDIQAASTEKEIIQVEKSQADETKQAEIISPEPEKREKIEDAVPAEPTPVKETPKPKEKPAEKPQIIKKPPRPSAAALLTNSFKIASLSAEIRRKMESKAKRPKRKFISASTKEFKYASYMEAWRSKVERVGNLNYPDEARRKKLSGKLIMDVALKPDGSILEITIRKSSGQKVLDDAAVRIVELSAPFAEFPDNFRSEVEILHITRTWQFVNNKGFR